MKTRLCALREKILSDLQGSPVAVLKNASPDLRDGLLSTPFHKFGRTFCMSSFVATGLRAGRWWAGRDDGPYEFATAPTVRGPEPYLPNCLPRLSFCSSHENWSCKPTPPADQVAAFVWGFPELRGRVEPSMPAIGTHADRPRIGVRGRPRPMRSLVADAGRSVEWQASVQEPFPGWPSELVGPAMQEVPLSWQEQLFQRGFPGRVAKFRDGDRTVVVRWVTVPTRRLHPASDCYRGLGYAVKPLSEAVDAHGRRWGRFRARGNTETVIVRERICDSERGNWTDASSWFWSAILGNTRGPWWAITIAEPAPVTADTISTSKTVTVDGS